VPWQPELFSAPVLARLWEDDRRRRFAVVPFFAGLMTGQTGALIDSFAREPELHHPIRGRVKGIAPFERFVTDTNTWLAAHNATVEDVDFILTRAAGSKSSSSTCTATTDASTCSSPSPPTATRTPASPSCGSTSAPGP
jgi:hypothetical protein